MKPQKRIFVSYHVEDQYAREILGSETKSDSMDFVFVDYHPLAEFRETQRRECRRLIEGTEVTLCLIGEKTHQTEKILWELETSYEMGHKVLGIRIYRDQYHLVPSPLVKHCSKIIYGNVPAIVNELEGGLD